MAFILAGVVAFCTAVLAFLMIFAGRMSDAPSQDSPMPVVSTLVIGFGISGLLVASHYFHFSW